MATSTTLESHKYKGRYMYLSCTQNMDIATNTSKISWKLTVTGGENSYYTTGPTTVKINGETVYYKAKTAWDTHAFPAAKGSVSGTTTVKHDDATGEASITISIKTNIYTGVLKTSSKTWTLDKIPRFATIDSAPDFNDEENPKITYSNPAGDNVTLLRACISLDGSGADVAYRDISKSETSYTFNLTEEERDVLRAATTGSNSRKVRFYVWSEIGGAEKRVNIEKTFTIKNPKPIISPTIVDTNDTTIKLTGDGRKLVKYYSNAAITIGASAVKKAALVSQGVTCGGINLTGDGTINGIENNSFVFTATDNRKNTTTTDPISVPFVEYIKPTCSLANNMPDAEGNMNVRVTGNYFNGSFGEVDNSLKVYYRYKAIGDVYSAWNEMDVVFNGNTYSATASLSGLDYQTTYVFQAYADDELLVVESTEKNVKATPVFDWSEYDFRFNVPVNVQGVSLPLVGYPVGSLYLSVNDETSPAELFGGSWTRIEDTFLWAAPEGSELGITTLDGERSHTLTVEEMPSHRHTINRIAKAVASGTDYSRITLDGTELSYTNYTGAGEAHNNMPPYINIAVWMRIA